MGDVHCATPPLHPPTPQPPNPPTPQPPTPPTSKEGARCTVGLSLPLSTVGHQCLLWCPLSPASASQRHRCSKIWRTRGVCPHKQCYASLCISPGPQRLLSSYCLPADVLNRSLHRVAAITLPCAGRFHDAEGYWQPNQGQGLAEAPVVLPVLRETVPRRERLQVPHRVRESPTPAASGRREPRRVSPHTHARDDRSTIGPPIPHRAATRMSHRRTLRPASPGVLT